MWLNLRYLQLTTSNYKNKDLQITPPVPHLDLLTDSSVVLTTKQIVNKTAITKP